jgi:hypothetical protein
MSFIPEWAEQALARAGKFRAEEIAKVREVNSPPPTKPTETITMDSIRRKKANARRK